MLIDEHFSNAQTYSVTQIFYEGTLDDLIHKGYASGVSLYFLLAFTSLVLLPSLAHAWGPVTHLEYAGHALSSLAIFAPLVKKLISKYQDHFLYGVVAADITLGKDLRGYLYNCHNWEVAFDLLEDKAKKDHERAFMLGYLGHLAADTVAHNFFVPFKMIRSWNTKLLNHVYWEMRFDLSVPEKYWKMMGEFKNSRYADDDALLEGHLKRTIFSFKTNKTIFNSLLMIQRLRHYKKFAHKYAAKSIWTISEEDIKIYKKLAVEAMIDFLKNPQKSYCLKADPTGKLKILYAREIIKQLRHASKQGFLADLVHMNIFLSIKKQMKAGIYRPVTLPFIGGDSKQTRILSHGS